MGKLLALFKASMTEGMRLFRFGKKRKNSAILPIFLAFVVMLAMGSYASLMLDYLGEGGHAALMLLIFVLATAVLTLTEGVYKTSSLLFGCKDDDLLLALPIKKSTVLLMRMFKFYLFEVMYNALFMAPAMVVYAVRFEVGWTYYLTSVLALLLLPVVPVVISSFLGGVISLISSRFKMKSIAQTIATIVMILALMVAGSFMEELMVGISDHAASVSEVISRVYYPAGAYASLVTDFSWVGLGLFVLLNVAIFVLMALIFGKIYYKINSRVKVVKTSRKRGSINFKRRGVMHAMVHKEFKKFVDTPVFVINAGFGLVLFVVACVVLGVNAESVVKVVDGEEELAVDLISLVRQFAPAVLFGMLCVSTLLSSITSSVISLEGRAFNILKSVPVSPKTILMGKVLAAVLIMLPPLIIGDIVMFVNFEFNLLEMILIVVLTVVLSLVAELIGIMINLKYPKMDASSDAEVVKQSVSSLVAVFIGLGMTMLSAFLIVETMVLGVPMDVMLSGGVVVFLLAFGGLMLLLHKKGEQRFLEIEGWGYSAVGMGNHCKIFSILYDNGT